MVSFTGFAAGVLLAAGQPVGIVQTVTEQQGNVSSTRARHEICHVLSTGAVSLNFADCLSFDNAPSLCSEDMSAILSARPGNSKIMSLPHMPIASGMVWNGSSVRALARRAQPRLSNFASDHLPPMKPMPTGSPSINDRFTCGAPPDWQPIAASGVKPDASTPIPPRQCRAQPRPRGAARCAGSRRARRSGSGRARRSTGR